MRWIVAAFHCVVAVVIATLTLWLLAQAQLGLRWEAGFYGQASPASVALLFGSLVGLGFSGILIIAALGYATRRRWGPFAMFGSSAMLMLFGGQTPLAVFAGFTGALAMLEIIGGVWARLREAAEREDDDDD